jgi:hypothetical protein
MIAPDIGSAVIEPAAMAKSTRPSADGDRSRRSRTAGIREAHEANAKPEPTNATAVARAAARGSCAD